MGPLHGHVVAAGRCTFNLTNDNLTTRSPVHVLGKCDATTATDPDADPNPTPLPTTYLIRLLAPDDLAALEHVFPRPRRHTQFGAAVACGVERVAGQPGVLAVGATRVRRHVAEVSGGKTGNERPLPRRCSCRCVTVDLPLQEVRRISWGGGRGQESAGGGQDGVRGKKC